ncbi:MAG: hypothetical protein EP308_06365 [Burkholderiales bacterium]|nr:MAG: hypothetical protein EP308_06365 [Burkholderiales bacterium]
MPALSQEIGQVERTVTRHGELIEKSIVSLPDALDLAWMANDVRIAYRWHVPDASIGDPRGVWIYRAGAPYQLAVNGRVAVGLLDTYPLAQASRNDTVINGRSPTLFPLPAQASDIELSFQAPPFMNRGLTYARVGSVNELTPVHLSSYGTVAIPAFMFVVLAGTLWVFSSSIWLVSQRTPLIALFAGLCGTMTLRYWMLLWPSVPFSPTFYEQVNPYLIMCFVLMALVFNWLLTDQWSTSKKRWVTAFFLTYSAFNVAAFAADAGTVALRMMVQVVGNIGLIYIIVHVFRSRQVLPRGWAWAIGGGYLLLLLCSFHDLGLAVAYVPYARGSMLIWGQAALLLAYGYVTSDFVSQQLRLANLSKADLDRQVSDARAELASTYAALARHEKLQAAREERQHIVQELHDSLGSRLITLLRGVRRDALATGAIIEALEDGLSDLRQVITANHVDGRLVLALGNWRQNWEERLERAGVQMSWHLDDSVDEIILSAEQLHQLLFLVQEAATNVLKHADATVFGVTALHRRRRLILILNDNGLGWPSSGTGTGLGLKGMRQRAARLGARIRFTSLRCVVPTATHGAAIVVSMPCVDNAAERAPVMTAV